MCGVLLRPPPYLHPSSFLLHPSASSPLPTSVFRLPPYPSPLTPHPSRTNGRGRRPPASIRKPSPYPLPEGEGSSRPKSPNPSFSRLEIEPRIHYKGRSNVNNCQPRGTGHGRRTDPGPARHTRQARRVQTQHHPHGAGSRQQPTERRRSGRLRTSTITRTIAHDPTFADQVARAEESSDIELFRRIRNASKDPRYWRSAAWCLERRNPEEFGPRAPCASLTSRSPTCSCR